VHDWRQGMTSLDSANGGPGEPARPEPAVRAPAAVAVLVFGLMGLFALQSMADQEAVQDAFGFAPRGLAQGEWTGLLTSMFVHGNWPHVMLNAIGALAFGAPVARLLGASLGGAVRFYIFYMVCGVLSALGYAALHLNDPAVLVGASGAVSGLMGAASRLIDRRENMAPFGSRTVIGMAVSWLVINLLMGFGGLEAVSGGAAVAWEAHLFGYAAGLLLIEPAARLAGWRPLTED
jgi:membrane associated rhomboid family serine protease